jgi:hypothetical protein
MGPVTDSRFYNEPSPIPVTFGPVFVATYESRCPACLDLILPGEDVRADGPGYIHANDRCERIARREGH